MYQFVGKEAPFLILAALALLDGCKYQHLLLFKYSKKYIDLI